MSHFNRQKLKYLSAILAGKLTLLTPLHAEVIQFFTPFENSQTKTVKANFQSFIANDPVSIDAFLHKWHGKYTPEDSTNLALLDSRFDFGVNIDNNYYLGYFYQYDVFINTQKGFTDLFYAVKNKNELIKGRKYSLDLEIDGIKQHGLILSKDKIIFDNDKYSISLAGSFYLSYGIDMQDGYVRGGAKAFGAKDYEVGANSSYHYTHNYLYHLKIKNTHGYGYGTHIGINIIDKKSLFGLKFLVNDIFSSMHWKDLPYSKIVIETKNKSYDESGYVKYSPSISGLELYRDYTQKLTPKYKLESSVILENSTIFAGIDLMNGENFPYVKILHKLDEVQTLEMMHESRFGSFGFGYGYRNFKIGIVADEFSNVSTFGLKSSLFYRF